MTFKRLNSDELQEAFNTKVDNDPLQKSLPFLKEFNDAIADLQDHGVDINVEIHVDPTPCKTGTYGRNSMEALVGLIHINGKQLPFSLSLVETYISGPTAKFQEFLLAKTDYRLNDTPISSARKWTFNVSTENGLKDLQKTFIQIHNEINLINESIPDNVFNKENTPKRLPTLPKSKFK